MSKILIAYVPVLHDGYLKLFQNSKADILYLIGIDVINNLGFDYIVRKDSLRAIDQNTMQKIIDSQGIFQHVFILDSELTDWLYLFVDDTFIFPDEDISRAIADIYLSNNNVEYKSVFLRWHRDNVEERKTVQVHQSVSASEFEKAMMRFAFIEGRKSADWWRQVGGFIVKNNKIILVAHNTHAPHEQMPYVFGDPRAIFKQGIHIELSTADHAEAVLIAEAAREGISLEGADLFITDFPCPPCAKLIARSGIKRCFFQNGYAVLDGEDVLKKAGVELIYIDMK